MPASGFGAGLRLEPRVDQRRQADPDAVRPAEALDDQLVDAARVAVRAGLGLGEPAPEDQDHRPPLRRGTGRDRGHPHADGDPQRESRRLHAGEGQVGGQPGLALAPRPQRVVLGLETRRVERVERVVAQQRPTSATSSSADGANPSGGVGTRRCSPRPLRTRRADRPRRWPTAGSRRRWARGVPRPGRGRRGLLPATTAGTCGGSGSEWPRPEEPDADRRDEQRHRHHDPGHPQGAPARRPGVGGRRRDDHRCPVLRPGPRDGCPLAPNRTAQAADRQPGDRSVSSRRSMSASVVR